MKSDLNLVFLINNEKNIYKNIKNKIFVKSKQDLRKNKITNIEISNNDYHTFYYL